MAYPTTPNRRAAVVRVELVRERTITYPGGSPVAGPAELAAVARAVIGAADRELFVVLHLSAKHRINSVEAVATGTLCATLVHPREVYKGALLANACAIALAHNHPSGDPTPSPEDLTLTRQLMAAGEVMGVRVLDHVVLGDECYVSLRETTQLWSGQPFHR